MPCEVAVALDNEKSHSNNASVQRLNSQSNSFLFVPSKRGFKIVCLNTRSLSAHIDELRILLADSSIDVLAINEIWLDSIKSDNDVYVSGYQIIRRDRVDGQFDDGESENVEYWLLGDLNCNLGAPILDHKSKTLSGIADLYNPEQLIEEPTRITESTYTMIDLIFTSTPDNVASSGVSHVGISDHSLIYAFR